VVYESLYGNTRIVAEGVAEGLRERHEVEITPVKRADADLVGDSDVIVVGGPTQFHGLPTSWSRDIGAQAAANPRSGVEVEPDALGVGLREWLGNLSPGCDRAAAAFDTSFAGPAVITGRAGSGIAHRLRKRGYKVITEPRSFLVSQKNALLPGETTRARVWGVALACALEPSQPGRAVTGRQ
jgi:hypothetical protein